ncbi:hypothetical protein ACQ86I_23615 [Prescottella equi]
MPHHRARCLRQRSGRSPRSRARRSGRDRPPSGTAAATAAARRPPRVDIVAVHPGADRTLLDAAVEAGARGMVIVGTGVGNANPSFVAAAQDCIAAGIPVIVGTRVPNGDIVARYGNGGGADLADRGVLPAGLLRPAQARILLASALAVAPVSEIANIVRSHTHPTVATPATSHSSHR